MIYANPVVSCANPPNTGTAVTVEATASTPGSGLLEVRVGQPAGTLFSAAAGNSLYEKTGDWVGNGLEFFVAFQNAPAATLGSLRAYTLPVRDCIHNTPPPPAIRATRDCVRQNTFTVAYYTGTPDPVAIRANGPNGPIVALQDGLYDGLLDLTITTPTTYYLTAFQQGTWQSLASTLADPAQTCGQGNM
jgi:hypothetical protein